MLLSDPKVPSLDTDERHWWIIRTIQYLPSDPCHLKHRVALGISVPVRHSLPVSWAAGNTNLDFSRVHPVVSHNAADRHVTRQNDHIIADVPAGQLALLSCGKQTEEISSSLQLWMKQRERRCFAPMPWPFLQLMRMLGCRFWGREHWPFSWGHNRKLPVQFPSFLQRMTLVPTACGDGNNITSTFWSYSQWKWQIKTRISIRTIYEYLI